MNLPTSLPGTVVALFLISAGFLAGEYSEARLNQSTESGIHLSEIPLTIGNWQGREADEMSASSLGILQLDEYVRRFYRNPEGDEVFLYIGYWRKQSGEHQAAKHSPAVCLPANGWKVTSKENITLTGTAEPLHTRSLISAKKNTENLVYYWFFSGEQVYNDESTALLSTLSQKILHGRSDGGIVEIVLPLGAGAKVDMHKQGKAIMEDFVSELFPLLNQVIQGSDPEPS